MRKAFQLFLTIALIFAWCSLQAQDQEHSAGPIPTDVIGATNFTGFGPDATVGYAYAGVTLAGTVTVGIPSGTLTLIAPFAFSGFAASACKGGDGNYYIVESGPPNNLHLLDPGTGNVTLIGAITGFVGAETPTGIAYNPVDGMYYMTAGDLGASTCNLYSFDLGTLTATVIGSTGNGGLAIDLCISDVGVCYSYDLITNDGLTLDLTTGAATILGPLGYDPNFGQGMAYDRETGTIYLSAFDNGAFTGQFRTMDPATGATTLILDWGFEQVAPFALDTDVGGGVACFTDDFDAYTAGTQLVAQNNVDWDTWSGGGGTGEDPFVSDLYSFSGANSIVEIPGNDFIRRHGDLTTGKWYMSFAFYIPAGNSGYFNTMSGFDGGFEWAMEVNFDVGGGGRVDTAGSLTGNTVDFTWYADQWNQAVLVVDLDLSVAEFYHATNPTNSTLIATWDWTQGGTILNQLAVNDFYGGTSTDEMYIDDYYFCDTPPAVIPVELTSFTANVNHNGQVELNWSTASETNNQLFEIERRTEEGQFAAIGYVEGHGTTSEPQNYSYTDVTVNAGIYFYRLKQLDFLGSYKYFDEIEVDVSGPLTFDLEQNYPNPFNPSTNIKYSVPESGDVRLAVYNLVGEEVAVLVDGFTEAGFFEVTFDASSLSSGVYFYRLKSGNSIVAKKMLLMK